jgi:hypothetical protein
LKFITDGAPFKTFGRVLRLLDRTGFDWVHSYKGPELGLDVDRDELPSIETIDRLLQKVGKKKVPFGGLKAVLVYKNYQRIKAKVKVTGDDKVVKVRVKVKGPVLKSDWREFRNLVKKRFDVML